MNVVPVGFWRQRHDADVSTSSIPIIVRDDRRSSEACSGNDVTISCLFFRSKYILISIHQAIQRQATVVVAIQPYSFVTSRLLTLPSSTSINTIDNVRYAGQHQQASNLASRLPPRGQDNTFIQDLTQHGDSTSRKA